MWRPRHVPGNGRITRVLVKHDLRILNSSWFSQKPRSLPRSFRCHYLNACRANWYWSRPLTPTCNDTHGWQGASAVLSRLSVDILHLLDPIPVTANSCGKAHHCRALAGKRVALAGRQGFGTIQGVRGTSRCFPRARPTGHASELEEVSECGWVSGTEFATGWSPPRESRRREPYAHEAIGRTAHGFRRTGRPKSVYKFRTCNRGASCCGSPSRSEPITAAGT